MTRALRPLAAVILTLLAGQFLLGMVSNFYAQIPERVPGVHGNFDNRLGAGARWALLHGPPGLQAHVALGLTIGACTIALAALALRTRRDHGCCSPRSVCSSQLAPGSRGPPSSPTTKTTSTRC